MMPIVWFLSVSVKNGWTLASLKFMEPRRVPAVVSETVEDEGSDDRSGRWSREASSLAWRQLSRTFIWSLFRVWCFGVTLGANFPPLCVCVCGVCLWVCVCVCQSALFPLHLPAGPQLIPPLKPPLIQQFPPRGCSLLAPLCQLPRWMPAGVKPTPMSHYFPTPQPHSRLSFPSPASTPPPPPRAEDARRGSSRWPAADPSRFLFFVVCFSSSGLFNDARGARLRRGSLKTTRERQPSSRAVTWKPREPREPKTGANADTRHGWLWDHPAAEDAGELSCSNVPMCEMHHVAVHHFARPHINKWRLHLKCWGMCDWNGKVNVGQLMWSPSSSEPNGLEAGGHKSLDARWDHWLWKCCIKK